MQHITTSVVDSQKLLGCCHRSHSLLADPSLAMNSRDNQLFYRGHYIHKEVFWVDQIQPLHFRDLPVSICTLFPFPILLQTATFSHTCNVVGLVEAEYNCVVGHHLVFLIHSNCSCGVLMDVVCWRFLSQIALSKCDKKPDTIWDFHWQEEFSAMSCLSLDYLSFVLTECIMQGLIFIV